MLSLLFASLRIYYYRGFLYNLFRLDYTNKDAG